MEEAALFRCGAVFLTASALAFLLTFAARRAARRVGFVVHPGERRIHRWPVPLGGGVAIFFAFWLAVSLLVPSRPEHYGLWLGTILLVLVGVADDLWELRWYWKLAGQVAAALLFAAFGGRIDFVTHPFTGDPVYTGALGVPLTVVWLVALANMVNLIDGLDGLAAGICAIASAPLFFVAVKLGRWDAALLTAALSGSALGFLPHNFNPARILMGDTGAMFLGFTLGAISVEGALKGPATLAFVVPVLAFGVPILDTVTSVLRRIASGRPFYARDMGHLHHRLLAMGLSHRQAVLALYALSGVMGLGAFLIFDAGFVESMGVLALVAAGAALFAARIGSLKEIDLPPALPKDL